MKVFNLTPAERKQLKEFGYVMGAVLSVVFGILAPWLTDYQGGIWSFRYQNWVTPLWPWAAAAFFWLFALILPLVLKPIYTVWMAIGHVLGWINTRIILGILFYLVVLPMGLIMRVWGKDPMQRQLAKHVSSYRVISLNPNKNHIEKPY